MNPDLKNLVVEDSELQLQICMAQLNKLGFENVSGAANGNKAYVWLESNPADLIISDWEMPELNGLCLLKKVKGNPSLKDTPFIILTIHEDESKNQEALNLGAADYMIKPSTMEALS